MTCVRASRAVVHLAIAYCLVAGSPAVEEAPPERGFSYGEKGLQFNDGSGENFLWGGVRLQPRWATTSVTQDELPGAPVTESSDFQLNRGRLKLGGNLVKPAFTVYTEYDFVDNRLLDLRATYKFAEWLSVRVGQWKSEFNRERVDSSGAQQFVERSVVTPWFTIDRQKAVMASGRFRSSGRTDLSYWAGWLSGAGRGGDLSAAEGLWLGRLQWNVTGRVLGFSQSAISRPKVPAGSIAIAAVRGRSAFTAFSSAGGEQLPGFAEGGPDRYRLEQVMLETAYQHRGFSWQQELHWKQIDDRDAGGRQRLMGGYAQAGMFFSDYFDSFPMPLELALRYAHVDPNRAASTDKEEEFTVACNWFFQGHCNKLTLDLSRVTRKQAPESDSSNRVRLQWDWSF